MEKIYCSECGTELTGGVKFCSNCGTKIDYDFTPINDNEDNNNNSQGSSFKVNKLSNENNRKNLKILAIAGICLIIVILAFVLIGSSGMNSSDNSDNSQSEPFIENIYGIDFSIPGYFKKVVSIDYEESDNGDISCTRSYERPDGTGIAIMVATSDEGWDLNNGDGYYTTINGHYGKLSSARDVFGYISGDKLVVISGTSQEEVESIIIE